MTATRSNTPYLEREMPLYTLSHNTSTKPRKNIKNMCISCYGDSRALLVPVT
jgi:hypothetical protein